MIDEFRLQEVRWRGLDARMLEMNGRRISCGVLKKEMELVVLELWWSCCVKRW